MITEERLPHFCDSSNLLFSPQKEKLKEYRSSSSVICHLDFCLSLITFRHSPFVRKIHNRRSFSYQLNKNNIKTFFELFFFQLTCSCACLMPLFFYFFFLPFIHSIVFSFSFSLHIPEFRASSVSFLLSFNPAFLFEFTFFHLTFFILSFFSFSFIFYSLSFFFSSLF